MASVRYRHFTLAEYEAKVLERFWAKVDKTETCWLWNGQVTTNGYGAYSFTEYLATRIKQGERREVRAHRYAWEKEHGPIPEGAEIDHICHNRLCVRPSHLRPTTRKQNGENRSGATARSKSGVRGVSQIRSSGRWRAVVGHNGKSIHVGNFGSLEEAEAAVIAKRNELHTHNDMDRKPACARSRKQM